MDNLEKAFGIQSAQRHKDNATSVHIMVKKMEQSAYYNPVLLYKSQIEPPLSNCLRLSMNEFMLVLQTELQYCKNCLVNLTIKK